MSAEFRVFFSSAPSAVEATTVAETVPAEEVEHRVAEARKAAVAEVRDQYEAQLAELRTEAVEFHQSFFERLERTLDQWTGEWEREVPELVFAGVRAVLADFEMTDAQLHEWVQRALQEQGVTARSEIELRLSPANAERLERYWAKAEIALPAGCQLRAMPTFSDLECRLAGKGGILDASLTERLKQLQRLWKLAP